MQVSADAAFGAASLGMFLIYVELCTPGLVVPGALGAMGMLAGGWLLWQRDIALPGVLLLAAAIVCIAAAVRLRNWRVFTSLAVLCCCAGSILLVRGPDSISPILSIPVSAVWGLVTIALGRLAWKAHLQKRKP
jgi:membrane-bound serine protease (ClpP class)